MKKQNVIMVAVILVIALVGILAAGGIQGWFDTADETVAVLRDIRGIVRLEREGVSFSAENGTVLRAGDRIVCEAGATAAIYVGDGYQTNLDGSTIITILDPRAESFQIDGETVQTQLPAIAEPVTPPPDADEPETGKPEDSTTDTAEGGDPSGDAQSDTSKPDSPRQEPSKPDTSKPETPEQETAVADTTDAETTVPETTEAETTEPETTEPETTEPEATEAPLTCTLAIRCDTILENMDNLDPAKAPYVPSNGWILYAEMEFDEGETVFDVLTRACKKYGIQIEYSWTPMYDSYYIEGINNLYEFDCGSESGWMYKVNGWFPNYGCSAYTVSGGDTIVWTYTCNGLGADVGA